MKIGEYIIGSVEFISDFLKNIFVLIIKNIDYIFYYKEHSFLNSPKINSPPYKN